MSAGHAQMHHHFFLTFSKYPLNILIVPDRKSIANREKNLMTSIKYALNIIFLCLTSISVADELHIAVAANFAKPMEQLKLKFKESSGHDAIISVGGTGQLYAQIKNGAPFSVFLAADMKRPEMLVNEGMTVADSLLTYAIGQLVLWSSQEDLVDSSGKVLNSDKFQYLAIAHPKMAPYGTAAKQVLEKLGLWQKLQSKMVRGNNISQAYQFTATGNAELGFIALSQYQLIPKKSRGSHWLVDKTLYNPIRQGAVLLKKGEKNPAALRFMAFLRNPSTRKIIEKFGYEVP